MNSVHLVWFVALLGLLFCALMRTTSLPWAVAGVYALVSLPLVLMHGVNAYADIAMAAYLFLSISALVEWVKETDLMRRRVWLFLLSVSVASMLFVKNEALLLHLPPLTLIVLLLIFTPGVPRAHAWRVFSMYLGTVALVAVPWVLFKFLQSLDFGNGKAISGLSLSYHPDVPPAIFNDLFYTGSYLLFFPVLLLLLALAWRSIVRSPLGLLFAFLVLIFLGQFLIFSFSPLALEATRHTGFGRGMVQLLPSCVFLAVQLLAQNIARKQ